MSKGTSAPRTKGGNPSAAERKKTGEKGGKHPGSFPVFDEKSAKDALKLRRGSKARKASIERKAAKYDPAGAKKAREKDKGKGK